MNVPIYPYLLRNTLTGVVFVGLTSNLAWAKRKTLSRLNRGAHGCAQLLSDWRNLGGLDSFEFLAGVPWDGGPTYQSPSPIKHFDETALRFRDANLVEKPSGCLSWEQKQTAYKVSAGKIAAALGARQLGGEALFLRSLPVYTNCGQPDCWCCVRADHLVYYYRRGGEVILHGGAEWPRPNS